MTASLPAPVEAFRIAVNAGDTATFLSLFSPTGAVDDWGRRFAGHAQIQRWSDDELIGAKGTLTYEKVIQQSDSRVVLQTHWASKVFTGGSTFTFALEEGLITELKISAS